MHPDAVLISNYSSDYHRALHSFPTRRSSDLADFLFSFSFGAHFVYHQGFFDRVIDREHGIQGSIRGLKYRLDTATEFHLLVLGFARRDVDPITLDFAFGWFIQSKDHSCHGGFARTGFTHQGGSRAPCQIEADVLSGV